MAVVFMSREAWRASTMPRALAALLALVMGVMGVMGGVGVFFPPEAAAAAREKMSLRYLRGVHVLRTMNPGDHWPAVTVPRQVRNHDTTSALIAHRDRTFVLESVARDLSAAMKTGTYPEAGYFAAHALAFLSRHAEAAEAMKNYLAKAPFRDEDYLFLVRELYAAPDYTAAINSARRWQLRDNNLDACSEERLTYIWGSLQNQGRYREAMEEVLSDPCASWRGQLFFAKSCMGLGDTEGALARLDAVLAAFPDKSQEIHLLWNRLVTSDRYP